MGLLDPKSRIMDVLLTEEGRRQLSRGLMRIERVAFSDNATFYEPDAVSGSTDATSRIYFEASSLPQDQVTFRADDGGRLLPLRSSGGTTLLGGQLVSGSSLVSPGDDSFASQADALLASSLDNFAKLNVIASRDEVFDSDGFQLSPRQAELVVTDHGPVPPTREVIPIATHPELHSDTRFSDVANFRFMPPVVKDSDGTLRKIQGFSNPHAGDVSDFVARAQQESRKSGTMVTVKMDPTSQQNNTLMQAFEVRSDNVLSKLDVADVGTEHEPVYLVGKVVRDGDSYKFFNLFVVKYR